MAQSGPSRPGKPGALEAPTRRAKPSPGAGPRSPSSCELAGLPFPSQARPPWAAAAAESAGKDAPPRAGAWLAASAAGRATRADRDWGRGGAETASPLLLQREGGWMRPGPLGASRLCERELPGKRLPGPLPCRDEPAQCVAPPKERPLPRPGAGTSAHPALRFSPLSPSPRCGAPRGRGSAGCGGAAGGRCGRVGREPAAADSSPEAAPAGPINKAGCTQAAPGLAAGRGAAAAEKFRSWPGVVFLSPSLTSLIRAINNAVVASRASQYRSARLFISAIEDTE